MKFIADAMLGRLARWLRLLGHDTLYYPDIEDSLLIRTAREESRTILTRDTRLVRVRDLPACLLLHENDPFEQLKKVLTEFSLSHEGDVHGGIYSRCSLCNTPLETCSREDAKAFVPEYVYATSESFSKCSTCNKYYWAGTHKERLMNTLKEVL